MTLLRNCGTAAMALSLVLAPVGRAMAAGEPVKVSAPQAMKGAQQIIVGAFNIGFLFESLDNSGAKAGGGLIAVVGGANRAKSELTGVTPAMMQAITDAAYEDFKAQLAARGFTVVDGVPMYAHADFAKVKPVPAPYQQSVALEKGSKGLTSFYKPSVFPGLVMIPGDFTSTGMSGLGMTMSSAQTSMAMYQHARTTGAAIVDVVYMIDFSDAKRPGAFSFAGIKVNSGMSVVANYSKATVMTPAAKATVVTLREPVAVEGDFAEMADTTGGVNKAGEAAVNIAGGVAAAFGMGGIGMGKTRKFTFNAKPAYQDGAIKAATLANTRVVDQLAALR